MSDEIQIAKILRPHGIKGALKVAPTISVPLDKITTVSVGEDRETMHIKRIQHLGDQFLLVQIDEITSCEQAEFYRNQFIYADKNRYEELKDVVLMSDYIGVEVFDENGNHVGVVVDVNNYGSADVISINCGGTTYMVPYIEDTLSFDKENNKFIIDSKRFKDLRV